MGVVDHVQSISVLLGLLRVKRVFGMHVVGFPGRPRVLVRILSVLVVLDVTARHEFAFVGRRRSDEQDATALGRVFCSRMLVDGS
jgi:hypothetical protein